ncbi:MAG: hypothetical protein KME21_15295 [Desmonostoc vinosum HA7617-LM4]|jgi:hypothetical protein|nr:hypothetical protein [Desmonostoc vinosum HA7617-LM4]
MATIIFYELQAADAENFINDLTDRDSTSVYGGQDYVLEQNIEFLMMITRAAIALLAIYAITQIAKSFTSR